MLGSDSKHTSQIQMLCPFWKTRGDGIICVSLAGLASGGGDAAELGGEFVEVGACKEIKGMLLGQHILI